MRVIGGEHRGANLSAPPGKITRPITDRAKESLFSILGHRFGTLGELPPIRVLDLFAGSGSLGIEALSRGAAHCRFVERDRGACETLRGNLAHTHLTERATLTRANAWALRFNEPPDASRAPFVPFGLVFVDPPYADARDAERVQALLGKLAAALEPGALVVVRHGPGGDAAAVAPRGLRVVATREFGGMRIVLMSPGTDAAEHIAEGEGREPVARQGDGAGESTDANGGEGEKEADPAYPNPPR